MAFITYSRVATGLLYYYAKTARKNIIRQKNKTHVNVNKLIHFPVLMYIRDGLITLEITKKSILSIYRVVLRSLRIHALAIDLTVTFEF